MRGTAGHLHRQSASLDGPWNMVLDARQEHARTRLRPQRSVESMLFSRRSHARVWWSSKPLGVSSVSPDARSRRSDVEETRGTSECQGGRGCRADRSRRIADARDRCQERPHVRSFPRYCSIRRVSRGCLIDARAGRTPCETVRAEAPDDLRDWTAHWPRCCRPASGDPPGRAVEGLESPRVRVELSRRPDRPGSKFGGRLRRCSSSDSAPALESRGRPVRVLRRLVAYNATVSATTSRARSAGPMKRWVVEPYAGQRVVDRPKGIEARCVDQVQTVGNGSGAGREAIPRTSGSALPSISPSHGKESCAGATSHAATLL